MASIKLPQKGTPITRPPPLTLDLLLHAAHKSILHPWVAWMVPLSLRAVTVPYTDLSFRLSVAYAVLLTLIAIFRAINERVAYGSTREVDLSEEVIVITGGASGLGRVVADFYAMKGVGVAVLDVRRVEEGEGMGIQFYECDVGDAAAVKAAAGKIKADVCIFRNRVSFLPTAGVVLVFLRYRANSCKLGTPTILINNAAIVHRKSLLELTPEEVEKGFRVNTLSHFHAIHTFLPGMLEQGRGTIVTVASVLGYLGCANLCMSRINNSHI